MVLTEPRDNFRTKDTMYLGVATQVLGWFDENIDQHVKGKALTKAEVDNSVAPGKVVLSTKKLEEPETPQEELVWGPYLGGGVIPQWSQT